MSSSLLWNLGHQDQLLSRKEMIMAQYQIRAVCHTFQDFSSEVLQEFLSHFGTVWPRIVMLKQNTFCKQSSAFLFQAGLNPSSVIHTVCTCIDSCSLLHEVSQQHTFMGPKRRCPSLCQQSSQPNISSFTVTQDVPNSMLAHFITRVRWWNNMLFSEEFITSTGILLQEWEDACGTQWAHASWNPNPWMILANILCERSELCRSSLTIIFLFLRTALSTHVFVSGVLAIVGLLPLLQSSSSSVCTPLCHTVLTLIYHSCKLQIAD